MKNTVRIAFWASTLAIVTTVSSVRTMGGDVGLSRDIPASLLPFEYLIGQWTGPGVRKDNPAQRVRGWTETHAWAWKFVKGKPIGLTVTIVGGKILTSGTLTYDPARRVYRLEAVESGPVHSPLIFEGTLDKTGKHLVLDHNEGPAKTKRSLGVMRLSLWPNANFIRYTMAHDLKEAGSVQFAHLIEVGLTRDGESLGGIAITSERPKCIVTGGAATMTMTYEGRTFPICCTGCRDEFQENPQKYLKKASMMAAPGAAGRSAAGRRTATSVGRFEDAFNSDVGTMSGAEKPTAGPAPGTSPAEPKKAGSSPPGRPLDSPKSASKTSVKKGGDPTEPAKQASRASSLLKLGQNLERAGNTGAALGYYRRIVKDFANTAAAKTAAERIRALGRP